MPNNPYSTTGGEIANSGEGFAVNPTTLETSFDFDDVDPLMGIYVTLDDQLLVTQNYNLGNNTAFINVRILRPDGTVIVIPFTMGTPGGRTSNTQAFQLTEGILLGVAVIDKFALIAGQCSFASVALVRNPANGQAQNTVLCSGYISGTWGLSWPASGIQRTTDGMGCISSNNVAAPGAGADWTFTVPNGARMRLITLASSLTTAIAVANRGVTIVVDDGANIVGQFPAASVQAASLTVEYCAADSITTSVTVGNVAPIAMPSNMILMGGYRVRSVTSSIQAADQWTATRLMMQEWLDAG